MIKHHPSPSLLSNFSQGQLSASLSIGVSAHLELCNQCQRQVMQQEEIVMRQLCDEDISDTNSDESDNMFDTMLNSITEDDSELIPNHSEIRHINIKGNNYALPRALQSVRLSNWLKFGKLARAKIDLNEGQVHANLLHIEAGGGIPQHTHKGFELTLLLAGTFSDDRGNYVAGDFIWLNNTHTHSPETQSGCLCYTVANDALHFTQGISKALNPIGRLIY
ncbi:ChrR family anti-sigma-E factor [Paraglaciecola sp.]|uniref:ChrR family anti-sigma-E factor n=1 Tax=Paraglaciecola sp. TaxID=1920173 RepID=UPI0030F4184C